MICERCSGLGEIPVIKEGRAVRLSDDFELPMRPCPDCLGMRNIHCCEGDRPQPDCVDAMGQL